MQRYFEALPWVNVNDHGEPMSINHVGVQIVAVVMRNGRAVEAPESVTLPPAFPNTRIVMSADPRVAGQLLDSGQYREIDPSPTAVRRSEESTVAARRREAHHRTGVSA